MAPSSLHSTSAPTPSRLVWTGGQRVPIGQMLACGALVWAAYAGLQVALVGPVLDESVVAAQILTGTVRYPPGHPLAIFVAGAFSLGYWLSGLAMWLGASVHTVSASRNMLFLFASTFVPFAVVVVLTRRPAWGHVAAVLTLSEATCRFFGNYLLWVFPAYYSSGHLGVHAALLATALLVGRCWLAGGLLLGALPALHAGMAVLVGPWAALYLLLGPATRRDRRVVLAGAVGVLLCCVAAAVWLRAQHLAGPALAPYQLEGGDAATILRSFIATSDPHRQPIQVLTATHLVSPLAFAALAWLILRPVGAGGGTMDDTAVGWFVALGALAYGVVYGTRAVQAIAGELPLSIAILMPARYANVVATSLLPLTVVAFARQGATARSLAGAILFVALVVEIVLVTIDRELAYAHLAYALWGALLAGAWWGAPPAGRRRSAAAALVLAVGLLTVWRATGDVGGWSFAAGIAGAGVVIALARLVARAGAGSPRFAEGMLALACLLGAAVALPGPYIASRWDAGGEQTSAYERELAAWLATHAQPQEPLLAPLWPPRMLQPKLGHPILVDSVTLLTPTYVRSLAVPVARLLRDVYGVDFADPDALARSLDANGRVPGAAWQEAWRRRACRDWIALRRTYGVRLVLAPTAMRIDLAPVLAGAEWTLHEIPSDAAGCAPGGP